MKNLHAIRSVLYTPALNVKRYDLASQAHADAVVIDWEDSIPLNKKEIAREASTHYFSIEHPEIITAIRINDQKTDIGKRDLESLVNYRNPPDFILMTKVDSVDEITTVFNYLKKNSVNSKLFITVESPSAIFSIKDLALACDGFIFGSADYAAELGVDIEWENMLHARHCLVAAAALADIPAIDTACFKLEDLELLAQECQQVKSLGFTGKAAMNVKQVAVINDLFSVSEEEIAFAKKIIAAYEKAGGGVIKIDGQLIGPPFVAKARKLLKRYSK